MLAWRMYTARSWLLRSPTSRGAYLGYFTSVHLKGELVSGWWMGKLVTDDRDAVVVFQLVNIKWISPQHSKALSCVENAGLRFLLLNYVTLLTIWVVAWLPDIYIIITIKININNQSMTHHHVQNKHSPSEWSHGCLILQLERWVQWNAVSTCFAGGHFVNNKSIIWWTFVYIKSKIWWTFCPKKIILLIWWIFCQQQINNLLEILSTTINNLVDIFLHQIKNLVDILPKQN